MTTQNISLTASARPNDSVVIIGWTWARGVKIPGCLGMSITRVDESGNREVITTKMPFEGSDNPNWINEPSTVWPIQRKAFMDFTAKLGKTYTYEVQAMAGTPGNLVPMVGIKAVTNQVLMTTKVDDTFTVAFTRGILSTQWMARLIGVNANGEPNFQKIIDALKDYKNPNNIIRQTLVGNVPALLMAPITECQTDGGHVYAALYELSAEQMVDFLLANLPLVSIILGNTGPDDLTNAPARAALHAAKADLQDRMIGAWGIAHNKSQVKENKDKVPTDVTTGSTNLTNTAFGCQSNMAIRIFNKQVAANFKDYWNRLFADNSQQSAVFRARNAKGYDPIKLSDGTVIETYFQPSMSSKTKPKGVVPLSPFLLRVQGLIADAAKDGDSIICGEVFYPGTPSVVNWFADAWNSNPELCMFMTVSTPDALRGIKTMRRAGRPPLFTIATGREKEFGDFIKELLKLPDAHAITHGKIVVIINKRTGKFTVIFGSDNLGAKASYGNDENGVIVIGNEKLAWFTFVNMYDINKHYQSRAAARASQSFKNATGYTGKLAVTDDWQTAWLTGYKAMEAEMLVTGQWNGKGLVDKPGAVPVLVVPFPTRTPKPAGAVDATGVVTGVDAGVDGGAAGTTPAEPAGIVAASVATAAVATPVSDAAALAVVVNQVPEEPKKVDLKVNAKGGTKGDTNGMPTLVIPVPVPIVSK